jgi:RNA recognition motif-containing protein
MTEEKVEHTIFVTNISFSSTGESLSAGFRRYGPVKNVRIITAWEGEERVSRGFGFVEFQTIDGFNAAVNAAERLNVDGRDLFVRAARPVRKRDTAFVRGIPEGTTEEDLKAAFARYNPTEVRLKFFDTEERPGFAFVTFDTEEHQTAAVRENKTIVIGGKESSVRFARPPQRRRFPRRPPPAQPQRAARAPPPPPRAEPADPPRERRGGRGFRRRGRGGDRFSYVPAES